MPLSKALEIWTAQTLCDTGILLSVVSFLLHAGRPYFDRILARFTLRVASDLWHMAYVVARDGSLFAAALLGFLTLNPDLMADIKIGLPFVPLGTVALASALSMKVFSNTEDLNRSHLRMVGLVASAAALNVLGYVLVMEGPGSEYAASKAGFWVLMRGLRSNQNPELAMATFTAAMGLLGALGVAAFARAFRLLHRSASHGSHAKTES